VLFSYSFSRDGGLDKLVLVAARRRPLDFDFDASQPEAERYYRIDGEFLVLSGREICTLNIDYFYLEEEGADEGEEAADGESAAAS
jgi:hypothetical protein